MATNSRAQLPLVQPGKGYSFPKRDFGQKKRSFKSEWCEEFSWLHCDSSKDAVFCYLCMLSMRRNSCPVPGDQDFVSKGFVYWKDATKAFKKLPSTRNVSFESLVKSPGK